MNPKKLKCHIRTAAITALSAIILSSAADAQENGTLSGTVSDPQGAMMSNSPIQLRWNSQPDHTGGVVTGQVKRPAKPWQPHKKWVQLKTDSAGRFSVEVPAGNWDVFAYRDLFAPACRVALVESRKTTNIDLRLPGFAATSVQ